MSFKLLRNTLSLWLLGSALSFGAQISVTPLSIDFTPEGEKFSDINVSNVSQDMAYVKVEISRVDHPGTPEQKVVPFENNPEAFGLVASPARLAIPAQQTRRVRVLPLKAAKDEDLYYRIKITPVSGELESLLSPSQAIAAGVQIIVGYETKIFVRPANAQAKVSINRLADQITIKNTGNSNVLLYEGKTCDKAFKTCSPLPIPVYRLFAGNEWKFQVSKAQPIEFKESFLDKHGEIKSA